MVSALNQKKIMSPNVNALTTKHTTLMELKAEVPVVHSSLDPLTPTQSHPEYTAARATADLHGDNNSLEMTSVEDA